MRRKKHKQTRRAMRFYRINFGFRPPYKVVIDGNFAHALAALKRGDTQAQIEDLLGDKARLFTTKCVMKELKGLGQEFRATRQLCKGYALHQCGHDDAAVSAAECLQAQVDATNSQHFVIGTQDRGLQRQVMQVPGGAVMFVTVNGLNLETPSQVQKQHVQAEDAEHMAPGQVERSSTVLRELVEGDANPRERSEFRRKRTKGPNPLSMKKKRRKEGALPGTGAGGEAGGGDKEQQQEGEGKRKRQRRSRMQEQEAAA